MTRVPTSKTAPTAKTVETRKHEDATRKHIPTAEYQSVLDKEQQNPAPHHTESIICTNQLLGPITAIATGLRQARACQFLNKAVIRKSW